VNTVITDLAPAGGYLSVVTVLLLIRGRVPFWLHVVAAVAGVTFRFVHDDWAWGVLAGPLAALAVLVIGLIAAAGLVTGVTLLTLTVTLAVVPIDRWYVAGLGLALAALISTAHILIRSGKDRVLLLALQTMWALGLSPAGLRKPDLDSIPSREQTTSSPDADTLLVAAVDARRTRTYLAPYLLAGVLVVIAYAGV